MRKDSEPPVNLQTQPANSTTFKTCGWCTYTHLGVYKNNYCIKGKCIFEPISADTVRWDTKCRITNAPPHVYDRLIKNMMTTINDTYLLIGQLKTLKQTKVPDVNKNTPLNCKDRNMYYATAGDLIAIWAADVSNWYFGIVTNYNEITNELTFRLNGFKDEDLFACQITSPGLLLKSEYNYFTKHKDEFKEWCLENFQKSDNCIPTI